MSGRKYNVLLCLNHLSYRAGGVSTHILDLCKEYNHNSDIGKIVVACEWGEHIEKLKCLENVVYIKTSFWSDGMTPKGVYRSYRQLKSIVDKEKIDIVHVHSQRLVIAASLVKLKTGIPYIWTNHIDEIAQQRFFKIMCKVMNFPIISVSQQLKEMMISNYGCDPNRVFVVNNGTDMDRLSPLSEFERISLMDKYHIDKKTTPYVICELARICPIKGQLKLLKAINKQPNKKDIKVLIAGSVDKQYDDYYQELIKFIDDNKLNVEILNFSNPRDVFGISNLFVLPSTHEGFPLVCVEALAMNCSVLRTKTPGWHEMREWTTCIDIDNEDQLDNAIAEAIQNDFYKEKTKLGNAIVRKRFTKEDCANKTIQIYKNVINSSF